MLIILSENTFNIMTDYTTYLQKQDKFLDIFW